MTNVKTMEKKWTPANANVLENKAQAPNFELEYDKHTGKLVAYHTPFRPIKVLLGNPYYKDFKINNLSLNEAFDILKDVYTKEGASAKAERLYNKFQNYIQEYYD